MFEMIGSEASYLKSLMVAVSHFLGSQELQLILAKMEHHILFSNLTEVKRVSERRENREFVEVLRKLEDAPVCQRQNIKSFLVLPFQRIARLRIILEIDSGVQCMKPTEELVHLDKLVDFGSVKSGTFQCAGLLCISSSRGGGAAKDRNPGPAF
ncbi:rho guanine nucleotide exchange factor 19 [Conger conger]|uniref:rho guanine nucleotide exchange factor 19 n=1 Tax=Conger conger TaxID=82655 RepID=UPI002A5A38DE|nr:rho guanine nucleotide exchange factor 19 [Conger conger]